MIRAAFLLSASALLTFAEASAQNIRAGIIGLDTSHVLAFSKTLNETPQKPEVMGCRMVAAYPKGSPDIESSVARVPEYTEKVKALGVEIVPTIDALLDKVDVVFIETNDGRPHLEQTPWAPKMPSDYLPGHVYFVQGAFDGPGDVEFAGEPITIAFNPSYLADGLGSLHSERVTFGFTTSSKPAVLRPAGDDGGAGAVVGSGPFPAIQTDYVYLLMPVRLPG